MAKEIGIITIISGTVLIKTPDGKFHEAKVGEVVHDGDVVLGTARIALLDGSTIVANGELKVDNNIHSREVPTAADSAILPETSDVIVQALERGTDLNQTLDATAAGLGAGDGGSGSTFVTLGRILESVTGQQYGYGFTGLGNLPITEGVGSVQVAQTDTGTTVTTVPEIPVDPQPPVVPPVDPQPPVVPPTDPKPPVVPPTDPKPPVQPPTDDPKDPPKYDDKDKDHDEDDKEHHDNGGGNGVDDAPGNSGDHKGDDADGTNTPGTKDTSEDKDPKDTPKEEDHKDPKEDQGSDSNSGSSDDSHTHPTEDKELKDDQSNSGSSGNQGTPEDHKDDSDGSDVIPMPVDHSHDNNGWGNGDQDAPGNSGTHNNAENNSNDKEDPSHEKDVINVKDVLHEDDEFFDKGTDKGSKDVQHGSSEHGNSDCVPVVDHKDPVSQVIEDLLKNNGHHDS